MGLANLRKPRVAPRPEQPQSEPASRKGNAHENLPAPAWMTAGSGKTVFDDGGHIDNLSGVPLQRRQAPIDVAQTGRNISGWKKILNGGMAAASDLPEQQPDEDANAGNALIPAPLRIDVTATNAPKLFDVGGRITSESGPQVDDDHRLIVAQPGERVLDRETNAALESGQPLIASNPNREPHTLTGSTSMTGLPRIQMSQDETANAPLIQRPNAQSVSNDAQLIQGDLRKGMESGNLVEVGKALIGQKLLAQAQPGFPKIGEVAQSMSPNLSDPTAVTAADTSMDTDGSKTNFTNFRLQHPAMKEEQQKAEGNQSVDNATLFSKYLEDIANHNGAKKDVEPLIATAHKDAAMAGIKPGLLQNGYRVQVQDLKNQILSAKSELSSEGDAKAARLQIFLNGLQKQNPYGSALNHPGRLGKIEHVLSEVGQIAGSTLFPSVIAEIPGTKLNRDIQDQQGYGRIALDSEVGEREARKNLETQKFDAENAAFKAHYMPVTDAQGNTTFAPVSPLAKNLEEFITNAAQDGINSGKFLDPTQNPKVQQGMEIAKQLTGIRKPESSSNAPIGDAGVQQYHSQLDSLAHAYGLNAKQTADLKSAYAAQPTATAADKEKMLADARSDLHDRYQAGAEGRQVDREQRQKEDRLAGKSVLIDGQQMTWAEAKRAGYTPEDVESLPQSLSQKNRDKLASANSYVKVLSRYEQDFNQSVDRLTDADRSALGVLTSHHDKVSSNLAEGISSGVVDLVIGKPFSGYSDKLMGAFLTKEQFDKMSPAGKKLLSDYFTAIIANFADMKNQLGSVGRNPMQLQAEINTIPLPYLDRESASNQFTNKRDDLKNRYASIPHIKGQPYPFEGGSETRPESETPQLGDKRQYQGANYRFDGKQWVRQ